MQRLVLDIGGTNVRCAVIEPAAQKAAPERVVRRAIAEFGPITSLRDLAAACAKLCAETAGRTPEEVAIGFPGPIGAAGQVLAAPTLAIEPEPGESFYDAFREASGAQRIVLVNDLVAAGYAFVAQGHSDFHVVTISSGIGQKVFVHGAPVLGPNNWGGEVGHVDSIGVRTRACDCGGGYHIGGVSSGRGILRAFASLTGGDADRSALSLAAELEASLSNGDGAAKEMLAECLLPLAYSLAVLRMATGISKIFLTGGFVHQFAGSVAPILESQVVGFGWRHRFMDDASVIASKSPNDDVLIGLGYILAGP